MTERMREKTRRESVADRYSFGHKALSVVLSVVLLGFGWPAVNPSETFASDESAQADQVQAEVAQPEETQALEETADDSAAMALAAADEAAPVAASDERAAAESVADKPATASAPSASGEEEASAVEDAVEEDSAVDNQGFSQAAAAQAKTEYDISLVLKNASIKKADGTKFGKTESGNVWLDPRYTSPYKFYQFWLNVSDEDAERYVKIFTMLDRETIEGLVAAHREAPHLRGLQKALACEVTCMVHGEEEYRRAVEASEILFGGATAEALRGIDEQTFLQVFEGVPRFEISRPLIEGGVGFLALCTEHAAVFPSKGEARKLIQGGGVSLNKRKIAAVDCMVGSADLLSGRYLLVQKGKKNYYLIVVTD